MTFKWVVVILAFIGVASAYVAPLTFISPSQLAPFLSYVQLRHQQQDSSDVPVTTPLVIKSLEPFNSTVLPIVKPSAPLIYYNSGLINSAPLVYSAPLLTNSVPNYAPLAYNAPLIVNSAPIAYPGSGTYVARSVFKPIVNFTYAASPIQSIAHPAPYVISN